jgi:hypothetical protein
MQLVMIWWHAVAFPTFGSDVGGILTLAHYSPSSFRVLHGVTNRLNVGWKAGFMGEIMGASAHTNCLTCLVIFPRVVFW